MSSRVLFLLLFYFLWSCCFCDNPSTRIPKPVSETEERIKDEQVPTLPVDNQQITNKNDVVLENHDIPIQKFSDTLKKVHRKESTVQYHDQTVKKSMQPDVESSSSRSFNKLEVISEELNQSLNAIPNAKEVIENIDNGFVESEEADLLKPSHESHDLKQTATTPTPPDPKPSEDAASPDLGSKAEVIVTEHTPPVATVRHESEDTRHQHSDAMPSFDEWKKMMLAEQEKGGHKLPSPGPPGKKISSQKRRRNYASYECGAKIVASNSEAEGTSRILNELVDEYMLNPCKAKIWFIIELCESVQASQIELANFELFSSSPKAFSVFSSDNFPTRDWRQLGVFTAAEHRGLQSFPLNQEGYGKFIKIEFQSHYGKEHYCPLSVVRIYGTSMVDEYEEMETQSNHQSLQDDELIDVPVEDKGSSNIFGSATNAVYNMVKKAAQALGQQQSSEGESGEPNKSDSGQCNFQNDVCIKKGSIKGSSSIPLGLMVSPSSIQQSLFRHLCNCDQCVSSSRPSYYSIAQPHCRFFQAALGPVMFKAICDWYKSHCLVTLQKAPVVDVVQNVTKVLSPPPTVISVIIEQRQPVTETIPIILPISPSLLPVSVHNDMHNNVMKSINLEQPELPIEPTKTLTSLDEISLDINLSPSEKEPPALTEDAARSSSSLSADSKKSPDIKHVTDSVILLPAATTKLQETTTILESLKPAVDPSDKLDPNLEEEATLIIETAVIDGNIVVTEPNIEDFTEELKHDDEKVTEARGGAAKSDQVTVSVVPKESVFVRMNNRIKALELNMSLSSQYLQELSQRYRRQMEEMQRAFNRTIGALNATTQKADERDLKQQEVIGSLQAQHDNLTQIVDQLLLERSSVLRQMLETHIFLIVVECIIMVTIMSLCVRRISYTMHQEESLNQMRETVAASRYRNKIKRRNSADSGSPMHLSKVKKRCSSVEELAAADNLLIVEPRVPVAAPSQQRAKKKNRKKKGIHRSVSNPNMSPRKANPSLKRNDNERDNSAAGIIFFHSKGSCNERLRNNPSHMCENCNKDAVNGYHFANDLSEKRKTDSLPFQNLTNGNIEHISRDSVHKVNNVKEKFSFRKFLRLQKRESI